MKFVHYLDKISNVNAYALTAFAIFAFVFVFAVVYVINADKQSLQDISRMPLD